MKLPVMQEFVISDNIWHPLQIPYPGAWSAQKVAQYGNNIYMLGGVNSNGITGSLMRYQAVFTVLIPIVQ
jgi:hypothetical protein